MLAYHIHVNHDLSRHSPNSLDVFAPVVKRAFAECSLKREEPIHLTMDPWMQVECQKLSQKRWSAHYRSEERVCRSNSEMLRKPVRDKRNKRSEHVLAEFIS